MGPYKRSKLVSDISKKIKHHQLFETELIALFMLIVLNSIEFSLYRLKLKESNKIYKTTLRHGFIE
jgi:hypothetical protein